MITLYWTEEKILPYQSFNAIHTWDNPWKNPSAAFVNDELYKIMYFWIDVNLQEEVSIRVDKDLKMFEEK